MRLVLEQSDLSLSTHSGLALSGSTHSQSGMVPILKRAIASARDLLWRRRRKILVRLDAAHDDLENIKTCHQANHLKGTPKVEWLIKRNLRKESLESWREIAVEHGVLEQPLRKKVKRRRVRTVIQNLITIAARMIRHARTVKLRLEDIHRGTISFAMFIWRSAPKVFDRTVTTIPKSVDSNHV